jgi:hypothetical protein
MLKDMLQNESFSASDKKTYDAFKNLLESSENNIKLPSWDEIMQKTLDIL